MVSDHEIHKSGGKIPVESLEESRNGAWQEADAEELMLHDSSLSAGEELEESGIDFKAFEELLSSPSGSESESEPQPRSPFAGFDLPKKQPVTTFLLQRSVDLKKSAECLERTVTAVAGIVAANRGGSVPVPESVFSNPYPLQSDPQSESVSVSDPAASAKVYLKIIRTPDHQKTIEEMLQDLLKPLNRGWRRELLFTRASWTKPELVQYVTPDGVELRTMAELHECLLTSVHGAGLSLDNFSLHKSPVSNVRNGKSELIYIVDAKTGAKVLVKPKTPSPQLSKAGHYLKRVKSSAAAAAKTKQVDVHTDAGASFSNKYTYLEPPQGNRLKPQPASASASPTVSVSGLPCSMRCPAMFGFVPDIPCRQCLCLFHNVCVGIPDGMVSEYKKLDSFVCRSCSSSAEPKPKLTHEKPITNTMKRNPPNLAPKLPSPSPPMKSRTLSRLSTLTPKALKNLDTIIKKNLFVTPIPIPELAFGNRKQAPSPSTADAAWPRTPLPPRSPSPSHLLLRARTPPANTNCRLMPPSSRYLPGIRLTPPFRNRDRALLSQLGLGSRRPRHCPGLGFRLPFPTPLKPTPTPPSSSRKSLPSPPLITLRRPFMPLPLLPFGPFAFRQQQQSPARAGSGARPTTINLGASPKCPKFGVVDSPSSSSITGTSILKKRPTSTTSPATSLNKRVRFKSISLSPEKETDVDVKEESQGQGHFGELLRQLLSPSSTDPESEAEV